MGETLYSNDVVFEGADGHTRYKRTCACGALVWDVTALPGAGSLIVCVGCGQDHSPPIPWLMRLRFARYKVRKILRLYGWRRGVRMLRADWRAWWYLPSELRAPERTSRIRERLAE